MGFKDGMSAFARGVGQKAKGNYDIAALNSRISSVQKEICNVYTKLGENYYSLHKGDPEEGLREFTEQIRQLEIQTEELQRQLETTKTETAAVQLTASAAGTRAADGSHGFCTNCGAALPEDSMFCIKCGVKVEAVDTGKL